VVKSLGLTLRYLRSNPVSKFYDKIRLSLLSMLKLKIRWIYCFMKRDQALAILANHREELKALGVKSLDLFGSVARDEARPDSDIDFLVDFSIEASLFDLFRVQHYLEDILGCPIDLGTKDALREHLREPVLKEVIRAF
jgi:predicted nucleotidyltransferase